MSKEPKDLKGPEDGVDAAFVETEVIKASDPEIRRLSREKHQLENILLQYQVNAMKTKLETQQAHHTQVEKDLSETQRQVVLRQMRCSHRKGGMDMAAIYDGGNDQYFSVIKHRLPNGELFILCTRCLKEWRRPLPESLDYAKLLAEYQTAIQMPTDNKMSGAAQFGFTDNKGNPTVVSWGATQTV